MYLIFGTVQLNFVTGRSGPKFLVLFNCGTATKTIITHILELELEERKAQTWSRLLAQCWPILRFYKNCLVQV